MKRILMAIGFVLLGAMSAWAQSSAIESEKLTGIVEALDRIKIDLGSLVPATDWQETASYYNSGGDALWANKAGYTPMGEYLLERLNAATQAGMPISDALRNLMEKLAKPSNAAEASIVEAKLSLVLVSANFSTGVPSGVPSSGEEISSAKILEGIAEAKDPRLEVRRQLPTYRPFWNLYAAVPSIMDPYRKGGWSKVSEGSTLGLGDRSPRILEVKRRLMASGELDNLGAEPDLFDDPLLVAVKDFQQSHGLNDDGRIGKRTIEEMNVSATDRLRAMLISLMRMRDETASFEDRYMMVNIPAAELKVIDNGSLVFFTRAIVGRPSRRTPLLQSTVFQVKLNPDWTVPERIAILDMVDHEIEEPGYFVDHKVHVFDSDGTEIDPASVDWLAIQESGFLPYRLWQEPGARNVLGPMKLDFKNTQSVFIHGTSTPDLFTKQDRFFSSGCVRVERPLDLAEFLLHDNKDWNRERIDEVVRAGKTLFVPLARPISLHFVYWTAWVDESGKMQFRHDIYGFDKRIEIPLDLLQASNVH